MKPNVAIYITLLLLSFANIAAGDSSFQYKFKEHVKAKSTNSITAFDEKKRTVFLVTDSFGIGGATITLAAGPWPKHITLRFRYEQGHGFHRLEGFNITTSYLQARGGMQDSGRMDFYFPDADGKYDVGATPACQLNIQFAERNHAMEVTLPSNLIVGAKEVKSNGLMLTDRKGPPHNP